jgi:hypothetical protein
MSNFIKVVRNYEKVCKLGRDIIAHKDFVRKVKPDKLEQEWAIQEARIQEFVKATNDANEEWKKNPCSVNEFWTGWS